MVIRKSYSQVAEKVLDHVGIKKKHKVLIIGDSYYSSFLRALSHEAERKGASVASYVVPRSAVVDESSPHLSNILSLIREHKPDYVFFTFKIKNWPGRMPIYDETLKANPDRVFVTMPGLPRKSIHKHLLVEPNKKALSEHKIILESKRGGLIEISTRHPTRGYLILHGRVPADKNFKIVNDSEIKKGSTVNLPSGEVFFQPLDITGEIFLPRGTHISDMGVVKRGITMRFTGGKLINVEPSIRDRRLASRLLAELDRIGGRRVCELGIGHHPGISLKEAKGSPLLIEKVEGTFHLGFGDSSEWGNIKAKGHLDIVIPKGEVRVRKLGTIKVLVNAG